MNAGALSRRQSGRSVKLTTDLHPVSRLRVIGIYLQLPLYPLTTWAVEILLLPFTSICKYQISILHFARSVCVYLN